MYNKIKLLLLCILNTFLSLTITAQEISNNDTIPFSIGKFEVTDTNSTSSIEQRIQCLVDKIPALNSIIDISVSNISVREFVRAIATLSGLNINIAPEIDFLVVNNFSKVKVSDLLIFICEQYKLDIIVIGNIINIFRPEEIQQPQMGTIDYDSISKLLSLDFQNIPMLIVAKQITQQTGNNIVCQPDVQDKPVNIFLKKLPFSKAIENLANANGFEIDDDGHGCYLVRGRHKKNEVEQMGRYNILQNDQQKQRGNYNQTFPSNSNTAYSDRYELNVTKMPENRISVSAINAPITDIVEEAAKEFGANYYIGVNIDERVSLLMKDIDYETLLNGLFIGSKYYYIKDGDTYVIGDKSLGEFKSSKLVKFHNRPVDSLLSVIPEVFKKDLTISELTDINSILINGNNERVKAFEALCKEMDQSVPVIMIEVIIIDVNNSTVIDAGIKSGIGEAPTNTTGSFLPSLDLDISTKTINDALKGIGLANLGRVNSSFYLKIKALESSGIVNIRSTPILSTLNGSTAMINIGETEYYIIQQSNIVAGQTQVVTQSTNYSNVEAKLEVSIKPFVSGNDNITLCVKVIQSDFTARINDSAPPGLVSRNFESKIRVKNQEMVLLGGLEEKTTRETSSGVPFIQRVPVLKWFFSNRSKTKESSKLNIFIRPTIIG